MTKSMKSVRFSKHSVALRLSLASVSLGVWNNLNEKLLIVMKAPNDPTWVIVKCFFPFDVQQHLSPLNLTWIVSLLDAPSGSAAFCCTRFTTSNISRRSVVKNKISFIVDFNLNPFWILRVHDSMGNRKQEVSWEWAIGAPTFCFFLTLICYFDLQIKFLIVDDVTTLEVHINSRNVDLFSFIPSIFSVYK